MTLYRQHIARWRDCQSCLLKECRSRVVLARGIIPADVLFVGEAPGDSEDVVGIPFVGPAGRLLDHIIERALGGQYSYAITNLVCCVPKNIGDTKDEPPKKAILACRPRLKEFMELCQPELVVKVGLLAQKYTPVSCETGVGITHPAAILRMDASQQSLAIKRCVVTIEDTLARLE